MFYTIWNMVVSVPLPKRRRNSVRSLILALSLSVAATSSSVAQELPTGYQPAPGETAGTIVVLNKAANTANLVDVASGEIRATLATGVGPHEVAISPGEKFAVVADYGAQQAGSTLTVIDLAKREVVDTLDLGQAIRPHGIVFEPDGKHLWISAEVTREVWRVAFPSGEVVNKVGSDAGATHMVALAPDGRVYSANIQSGSTSVVAPDGDGFRLIAQVPTGAGAEGVCVTPDNKHAWLSNRAADTVSVVDTQSLKVVKQLPCAGFPIRAMATADGRMVLVSSATAGAITVFDALSLEVLVTIPMPFQQKGEGDALLGQAGTSSMPIGIALHRNSKLAFVANAAIDRVAIVDLVRRKVVGQLPTGRGPDGIAWVSIAYPAD